MRKLNEIRAAVRDRRPLIHCITNPISINQCANAVLAAGARPIMAEHPAEVKEITESADALVLNLGNITDVRMESMEIALRAAKEKGIPVVLDAALQQRLRGGYRLFRTAEGICRPAAGNRRSGSAEG